MNAGGRTRKRCFQGSPPLPAEELQFTIYLFEGAPMVEVHITDCVCDTQKPRLEARLFSRPAKLRGEPTKR